MSLDEPGIGMLIGMQYGSACNTADFAAAREKLRQAIVDAEIRRLSEEALKEAAKDCVGAVIGEIIQVANGQRIERRHSDPDANRARAEDFIDTAEHHLNRLSSGKLTFSKDSVERIKRSDESLPKIVERRSTLAPTVSRKPR